MSFTIGGVIVINNRQQHSSFGKEGFIDLPGRYRSAYVRSLWLCTLTRKLTENGPWLQPRTPEVISSPKAGNRDCPVKPLTRRT